MAYKTINQNFYVADGQTYELQYDKDTGNAKITNFATGGLIFENGQFKGAGNNFSKAQQDKLLNDTKAQVKSAASVVGGKVNLWVGKTLTELQNIEIGDDPNNLRDLEIAEQRTNFGIIDPNNELFSITAEDFQEDGAFKPENLIYPVSLNSSQNRINITQRRYVSSISALGETNSLNNPRFNQPATQEEFLGTVRLPMPNNISEANSTGWGENSLSTLATQVMTGALGVVNTAINRQNVLEGGQEAINLMKNFASNAESKEYIRQLLTLNAAASVTKFLGINVDPEAFRSRATGTVINPNLELLFNGPKLRSFGFEFKMIPRSDQEAKNIRYILKFFKKGMAAKRGTTGEGYFLGAPNVFDIEFKGSEKTIGKIKTCALQTFNVNYTPDGVYAAFKDSQPISVVMQLAFTELTPIYNDNYDENSDNVG